MFVYNIVLGTATLLGTGVSGQDPMRVLGGMASIPWDFSS